MGCCQPNYTIQSLPEEFRCKCTGYKGVINEETEQELVSNPTKKLDLDSKWKLTFGSKHIGDNLFYKIIHRDEDENFDKERKRFQERQERLRKEHLAQMGYDDWTPWDGKSLESIATRTPTST